MLGASSDGRCAPTPSSPACTNPAPAQEGQPVGVLYEPDDPTIVWLAGWQGSGQIAAGMMIVFGAAAMVLGTFVGLLFALFGDLG